MSNNFLEQLAAEYYEYNGCFVRRNVKVDKRDNGGYNGELDVVAYDPEQNIIFHIEATMDAHSWEKRKTRFQKKFDIGKNEIPKLFKNFCNAQVTINQIVLLGYGSDANYQEICGGEILTIEKFLKKIISSLRDKDIYQEAVPENYPLLRTVQFMISKNLVVEFPTSPLPKEIQR
jgi:hypothetical protein